MKNRRSGDESSQSESKRTHREKDPNTQSIVPLAERME